MAALRQTLRSSTLNSPLRTAFRPAQFRQSFQRQTRLQSTTAAAAEDVAQSKISQFWNSKIGPKTVHFWAPVAKWGVVLSGISDFARPAESLSLTQNLALMATGMIWTRWCFIIKPRNILLAAVNFFLFCVGAGQVTRVLMYRSSLKEDSVLQEVEGAAKDGVKQAEAMVKDPKGAIKKAENV